MSRQKSTATLALACHHEHGAEWHGPAANCHPEAPARLQACLTHITSLGLWNRVCALPRRLAANDDLQLCHSRSHILGLEAASRAARQAGRALFLPAGGQFVSADGLHVAAQLSSSATPGRETYVTGGSMTVARGAVGGLLSLVDTVLAQGEGPRVGLGLCRPPGHHAGKERSEGFCLFNNVAIATRYARVMHPDKVKRVLIFDWDVHHGQGTQELFWEEPDVLFVSAHRREEGHFYPGSGALEEVGQGLGSGCTVNVPLPAGFGDGCLWATCSKVLLPAARRFRPDLIVVSAGFDAVTGDPLGGCTCTPQGFGVLTMEFRRLASELCGQRLLLALEGGYELSPLSHCISEVLQALVTSHPSPSDRIDPFSAPPAWLAKPQHEALDVIKSVRTIHSRSPFRLLEGCGASLLPALLPEHVPRKIPTMATATTITQFAQATSPTQDGIAALQHGMGSQFGSCARDRSCHERSGTPPPPSMRKRLRQHTVWEPLAILCFGQAVTQMFVGELDNLARLRASMVTNWHEDVTHVIASKLLRTERLMCAICRGQHVVTPAWVTASLKQKFWADEAAYALQDRPVEALLGTKLRQALERARSKPLLRDFSIYLAAAIEGESRRVAARLVEVAGGQLLTSLPAFVGQEIIILDVPSGPSFHVAGQRHVPSYSLELLFEGAVTQELRWHKYQLRTES